MDTPEEAEERRRRFKAAADRILDGRQQQARVSLSTAASRLHAARSLRDRAVRDAITLGLEFGEIAELAGITVGKVHRIARRRETDVR
jgi:DNA-directed RNA polymerase specialized sigma24 family protein